MLSKFLMRCVRHSRRKNSVVIVICWSRRCRLPTDKHISDLLATGTEACVGQFWKLSSLTVKCTLHHLQKVPHAPNATHTHDQHFHVYFSSRRQWNTFQVYFVTTCSTYISTYFKMAMYIGEALSKDLYFQTLSR